MCKQLWKWVTDRGWNSWEGSEDLPRDLLSGFDQNADNDRDKAEVLSDGDEKLIEN